jgi:DNA-binding FadR family transcriptional regulator
MRPRQQVEHQLRSAILNGDLPDGTRFPSEAKLSQQFGVSRATIREALRGLSEAGLVWTVPGAGGGSFVKYVDHHKLADVVSERLSSTVELGSISYEEVTGFRELVEIPAARLAATTRTDEHVALLRAAIEESKRSPLEEPKGYEANVDFHAIVAEASGNRLLAAFIGATLRVTRPVNKLDPHTPAGKFQEDVIREHTAIADAIANRDPDEAERLTAEHLTYLNKSAAKTH